MTDPRLPDLLAHTSALHNHLCPRQVLGVRMGLHAAEVLDLDLPQTGKRLLTIVETDGCFADGVSVATNCWLGRRTLRCVDHGKVAATFVDTLTGEAVRIHPAPAARTLAATYAPAAVDRWHAYLEGYQVMPVSELLVVASVRLAVPIADLISRPECRVACDNCHEEIFNEREVLRNGQLLCRACAGEPYLAEVQSDLVVSSQTLRDG